MTLVKTSIGYEAEVDENALDDMQFLEALGELEDGKSYALAKIAALLLGPVEKKKLYGMLKNENGRVPFKAASEQLTEIMQQLKPAKN